MTQAKRVTNRAKPPGEILGRKIASWGGVLLLARCLQCREKTWFDGSLFVCEACAKPGPHYERMAERFNPRDNPPPLGATREDRQA